MPAALSAPCTALVCFKASEHPWCVMQAGSKNHYHVVIQVLSYIHDQLWQPLFTPAERTSVNAPSQKLYNEAVWRAANKYCKQKVKAHE